jgi:hypothetical protein
MTKEEKFALSWCYSRCMDYVEEHSPNKNPYEHYTGSLDLIVDGVNISQTIKELLNDQRTSST